MATFMDGVATCDGTAKASTFQVAAHNKAIKKTVNCLQLFVIMDLCTLKERGGYSMYDRNDYIS